MKLLLPRSSSYCAYTWQLLDASDDTAWKHHLRGCSQIIQARTPNLFSSDFDKALFLGQIGPTVSEALLSDTHCYLAQPQWTALYRSLAKERSTLTDRSPLVIESRWPQFKVSGLWHDVGVAVNGPQLFCAEVIRPLQQRCRESHGEFLAWMESYKVHCVKASFSTPSIEELHLRRQIFGAVLECTCLVKRLLATVCDEERIALEAGTQAVALLLLELQNGSLPKHSWLFTGHEAGNDHACLM